MKEKEEKKRRLSDAARLNKAKNYFLKIKVYNKMLNRIGFNISDRSSTICLFYGDSEEPIDSF